MVGDVLFFLCTTVTPQFGGIHLRCIFLLGCKIKSTLGCAIILNAEGMYCADWIVVGVFLTFYVIYLP